MKFEFFLLFLTLVSFDVFSAECSTIEEKINLKDLIFKLSSGGDLQASLRSNIAKVQIDLNTTVVNDSKISANVQLKNVQGKICKAINLEVDPTLLCRDTNGVVEPWTYWVYQTDQNSPPEYSIVSTRAIIDEDVFIRKSRVCGYSTLLGHVIIDNSNIESTASSSAVRSRIMANGLVHIVDSEVKGNFLFEDLSTGAGEIILRDTMIEGNPEIKSLTNLIYLGDVEITGNPKIEEKAPLGFATNAGASVFMQDVTITGSPQIKGGAEGLDLKSVEIVGSPAITGEAIFDNVRIINNGSYSAEAALNGTVKDRSVILGNVILKGNNNLFSGFYYINKHIENSKIEGSVVRNSPGNLVNIANLNNPNKNFVSSNFKGVGYISGDVQAGTTIHGYEVSGNYSGINFCASCKARNGSSLSGAIYTEGDVDLDNANVAGTSLRNGLYIQEIRNSLVQNSQTTGGTSIVNSTVMDQSGLSGNAIVNQSYVSDSTVSGNGRLYENSFLMQRSIVSGNAYISNSSVTNQSQVSENAIVTSSSLDNSIVKCNANVHNKILSGQFAGCNYPNKKHRKVGKLIRKEIDQVMADSVSELSEKNNQANKFKLDTLQRHYLLRKN